MWPDPQETANLVTFTEEILNGKLHFLCSVSVRSLLVSLSLQRYFSVVHTIFYYQSFKTVKSRIRIRIYSSNMLLWSILGNSSFTWVGCIHLPARITLLVYCCSIINFHSSSSVHFCIVGILLCIANGHHQLKLLSCAVGAKANN